MKFRDLLPRAHLRKTHHSHRVFSPRITNAYAIADLTCVLSPRRHALGPKHGAFAGAGAMLVVWWAKDRIDDARGRSAWVAG
jgi:hypothetical protein